MEIFVQRYRATFGYCFAWATVGILLLCSPANAPSAVSRVGQQFTSTSRAIALAGGPTMKLFRPPYGRDAPTIDLVARSYGMQEASWNRNSRDYALRGKPREVTAQVLRQVFPGAVFLLHDAPGGPVVLSHDETTLHALPDIIRRLLGRGYCFATLAPGAMKPRLANFDRRRCNKPVALTFDDGPDPEVTPKILRVLAAHKVKATFFVVGVHVAAFPAIIRAEARAGHVIGNHTWNHADLSYLCHLPT